MRHLLPRFFGRLGAGSRRTRPRCCPSVQRMPVPANNDLVPTSDPAFAGLVPLGGIIDDLDASGLFGAARTQLLTTANNFTLSYNYIGSLAAASNVFSTSGGSFTTPGLSRKRGWRSHAAGKFRNQARPVWSICPRVRRASVGNVAVTMPRTAAPSPSRRRTSGCRRWRNSCGRSRIRRRISFCFCSTTPVPDPTPTTTTSAWSWSPLPFRRPCRCWEPPLSASVFWAGAEGTAVRRGSPFSSHRGSSARCGRSGPASPGLFFVVSGRSPPDNSLQRIVLTRWNRDRRRFRSL